MKRVSVVIPTYRRSEFLPAAIKSVLAQTYREIEIVIVDDNGDGSPDREATERRMSAYAPPKVRYVKNARNLGGALARNVGIERASGQYITFLDDDDLYRPEKVAVQVAEMERGGWDLTFMDADMCAPDGRLIDRLTHDLPLESTGEALLAAHLTEHLTPTATYMFRAEALREIGGFDPVKTAHEFLLMLKAIDRGLKIGYIARSEVVQFIHPGQLFDSGGRQVAGGERISTGGNKVAGEKALYEVKRRYFHLLTPAQRRAISVRHYATLAFVHLKRREWLPGLLCGARSALLSPAAAARLALEKRRMIAPDTAQRKTQK